MYEHLQYLTQCLFTLNTHITTHAGNTWSSPTYNIHHVETKIHTEKPHKHPCATHKHETPAHVHTHTHQTEQCHKGENTPRNFYI